MTLENIHSEILNLEDITKPLVVSFENNFNNSKNSIFYKNTLDNNNWEYVFIGEGVVWNGFKARIHGYSNYLKNLPDDKVVILTDARDVFCTRNSITFMDAIKNFNLDNKIIVSGELFLHAKVNWTDDEINAKLMENPNFFWQGIPLNKYWKYYNFDTLPLRKYINSGLIFGKVKILKKAFEWVIEKNFEDDQLGFSNYTNEFPENISIDYSAEILHTCTFGVNGGFNNIIQKYDSPTFAELLGFSSYFLHIPGLIGSKGQLHLYNIVLSLIEQKIFNRDKIIDLYNLNDFMYTYDKIEYNIFR